MYNPLRTRRQQTIPEDFNPTTQLKALPAPVPARRPGTLSQRTPRTAVPSNVLAPQAVNMNGPGPREAAPMANILPTPIRTPQRTNLENWIYSYRRAFPTFIFYFDQINVRVEQVVKRQCLSLGAQVASFFSDQVTHVITLTEVAKPVPGAETSVLRPMKGKPPPAEGVESEVIARAKAYNMKLWSIDKLRNKILAHLLNAPTNPQKTISTGTGFTRGSVIVNAPPIRFLRNVYIYVEDATGRFRPPVMFEWPASTPGAPVPWPKFHMGTQSRSPFIPITRKKATVAAIAAAPPPPARDNVIVEFRPRHLRAGARKRDNVEAGADADADVDVDRRKKQKLTLGDDQAGQENAYGDEADEQENEPEEDILIPLGAPIPSRKARDASTHAEDTNPSNLMTVGRTRAATASGFKPSTAPTALPPTLCPANRKRPANSILDKTREFTLKVRRLPKEFDPADIRPVRGGRLTREDPPHRASASKPVKAVVETTDRRNRGTDDPDKSWNQQDLKTVDVHALIQAMPARPGYCENCKVSFKCLEEHGRTPRHRRIAEDDAFWSSVDDALCGLERPILIATPQRRRIWPVPVEDLREVEWEKNRKGKGKEKEGVEDDGEDDEIFLVGSSRTPVKPVIHRDHRRA